MAKTGIKITTTDTVLGAPIDVNSTSMIIVVRDDATLTPPVKVRSANDSDVPVAYRKLVGKYYNFSPNANLEGNLLWLSELSYSAGDLEGDFTNLVRATVSSSFDERPRQILIVTDSGIVSGGDFGPSSIEVIQAGLTRLQNEGIRCVAILACAESSDSVTDCATFNAPFVSFCPMADSDDIPSDDSVITPTGAARVLGLLSSLSVGTSIGDGGLQPLQFPNTHVKDGAIPVITDVRSMSLEELEELGTAQQLFTRTRPPRNGLWWNDGATCNSADNALSTLEMARTICSMADDLQAFFVPYINTRVPVTSTGDIQSTYKQVVLDNARAAVIQKYIENGDISDARISLVAKNNDMIGTRTWEVTLSILPAPTLRWIDGYVFYVKNLS